MLEIISDNIALISAITAIIVSIFSFFQSKRNSVLTSISSNRINWINELRNEIHEFLKEYLRQGENEYKLRMIRAKIELYLSNSEFYSDFSKQLKQCSERPFSEDDYNKLVNEAQIVFNDVWRRMKREAGISYNSDKRLSRKIEREKQNKIKK